MDQFDGISSCCPSLKGKKKGFHGPLNGDSVIAGFLVGGWFREQGGERNLFKNATYSHQYVNEQRAIWS